MRLEYVQGASDCPDSTPEEEEFQIQLENGNDLILEYQPTTTSIEEVLRTENHINMNDNASEEINAEDNQVPAEFSNCDVSPEGNIQGESNSFPQETPNRPQRRVKEISRNHIAENHARALQLFAEASMKQAEAALLTAENEKRRIELEERRLIIKEKRISVNEEQTKVLEKLQKITDILF
ncbi:hypothetical protein RF55_13184 [Lasius niger]|uniref:Uncharacterized protein n=1 Tax=Lasius niger TaxID=67767 RepID=A0A0J7KB55_LASNI|nr:hypothetical protein RF55_13184 [Lasius niger]